MQWSGVNRRTAEATYFRTCGNPRIYARGKSVSPDFLCTLVAPARFLRLSLTKAAYAVASCAACRKSGFSASNAKTSLVWGSYLDLFGRSTGFPCGVCR